MTTDDVMTGLLGILMCVFIARIPWWWRSEPPEASTPPPSWPYGKRAWYAAARNLGPNMIVATWITVGVFVAKFSDAFKNKAFEAGYVVVGVAVITLLVVGLVWQRPRALRPPWARARERSQVKR